MLETGHPNGDSIKTESSSVETPSANPSANLLETGHPAGDSVETEPSSVENGITKSNLRDAFRSSEKKYCQ